MRPYPAFAAAAALLLPLCNSSFAQCSVATVRGAWAFQGYGTMTMPVSDSSTPAPVPVAGLGTMNIDYQGGAAAHGTFSIGGQVHDVDWSNNIQVNPDCTASLTPSPESPVQEFLRLLIFDSGNQMVALDTKNPVPTTVLVNFWRLAQGDAQCRNDMVRGYYVGSRDGTEIVFPSPSQPLPLPFMAVLTATFQYDGSGTGGSTASMGGTVIDFGPWALNMQVNADCTATMKYSGTSAQFPGQAFIGAVKYIVINNGDQLIGLQTEDNAGIPIVVETLKRVSLMPAASGQ